MHWYVTTNIAHSAAPNARQRCHGDASTTVCRGETGETRGGEGVNIDEAEEGGGRRTKRRLGLRAPVTNATVVVTVVRAACTAWWDRTMERL